MAENKSPPKKREWMVMRWHHTLEQWVICTRHPNRARARRDAKRMASLFDGQKYRVIEWTDLRSYRRG